jgi:hypothetical protein
MPNEFIVEAEVIEVLPTFGLAHLRADSGHLLGVTRNTPGANFEEICEGQKYLCTVDQKFSRVLRCSLVCQGRDDCGSAAT